MDPESINCLWDHPAFRATALFDELRERPLGFVDVGARGGAHPVVEPIASGTAVLGFEPDPEGFAELGALPRTPWARMDFENVGLGGFKGRSALNLVTAPTNNSLREPDEWFTRRYDMPKWQLRGKIEVELDTLDNVLLGERRAAEPWWGEFLKLDTQGTEYEILGGARSILKDRAVAVVVEVEFFQIYKGQKLFSDVELFLRELGFSFYGFGDLGYRSRRAVPQAVAQRERLFWTDAYFLRDPLDAPARKLSPRQARALCTCALLLGFKDFALELAGCFLPDDHSCLEQVALALRLEGARRTGLG